MSNVHNHMFPSPCPSLDQARSKVEDQKRFEKNLKSQTVGKWSRNYIHATMNV